MSCSAASAWRNARTSDAGTIGWDRAGPSRRLTAVRARPRDDGTAGMGEGRACQDRIQAGRNRPERSSPPTVPGNLGQAKAKTAAADTRAAEAMTVGWLPTGTLPAVAAGRGVARRRGVPPGRGPSSRARMAKPVRFRASRRTASRLRGMVPRRLIRAQAIISTPTEPPMDPAPGTGTATSLEVPTDSPAMLPRQSPASFPCGP